MTTQKFPAVVVSPVRFPSCQPKAAGKGPLIGPVVLTINVRKSDRSAVPIGDAEADIAPKQVARAPIANVRAEASNGFHVSAPI